MIWLFSPSKFQHPTWVASKHWSVYVALLMEHKPGCYGHAPEEVLVYCIWTHFMVITVHRGYNCNFTNRSETKFHRMSHCMYNCKAWSVRHFITCKLLNCNYSHDIYLHLWYGHCFKLCCLVALISFWNVQIILSISHFNLLSNYIFTCFFF